MPANPAAWQPAKATEQDTMPPDPGSEPIAQWLSRHHVVTLACRDHDGCWAAAVFYANDGLDLYFTSSPRSRHIRSLAIDPRLAGAIHGNPADWRAIEGLQLAGRVEEVPGPDLERARALYAARFPFVAEAGSVGPELARALAAASWYRLRVDEAVVIDNTQGLGQRRHWRADGATTRAARSG